MNYAESQYRIVALCKNNSKIKILNTFLYGQFVRIRLKFLRKHIKSDYSAFDSKDRLTIRRKNNETAKD